MLWPSPGEQAAAERAAAELYGVALRRWVPHVRAAVLTPAPLTAAADGAGLPPPDPAGAAHTSLVWETIADSVVVSGLLALWAVVYRRACEVLGVDPPTLPEDSPDPPGDPDRVAVRVVAEHLGVPAREVLDGYRGAVGLPVAADVAAGLRADAYATPARITMKLVTEIGEPDGGVEGMRARAADALDPDSAFWRDYALAQSYHNAALQNHAVVNAAANSDEELEKTWICVHPDTVVSARGVTHLARRRYKGTLYAVRTASGAAVALTPQHRVLTRRGWVEAQLLHEGDDLFKVAGANAAGAPQIQDLPTSIGEIVDTAMNDAAAKSRVMRCAVDFHVDPSGGYVEVVSVDRPLALNLEALRSQAVSDFLLTDSNLLGHAAVLGSGGLNDRRLRLDPAPVLVGDAPVVGGLDVVGNPGCADDTGGGLVPHRDAGCCDHLGDLCSGASVPLTDGPGGLPGLVGGDDVLGCGGEVGAAAGLDGERLGSPHLRQPGGVLGAQLAGLAERSQCMAVTEAATDGLRAGLEIAGNSFDGLSSSIAGDDQVGVDSGSLGALNDVDAGGLEVFEHDTGARSNGLGYGGCGLSGQVAGCNHGGVDGDLLIGDDPSGVELSSDGLPGRAVDGGDLVEIFPGLVAADRVVDIECAEHDGFVYDLSTRSHFYLANELVISNCTLDAKTRRTHWAADGVRVPLNGKFRIGGAQLDFPGDPSGPPEESANCRCRVGVLAPDEDIPDEVDRHTERLDGRDSVAINRDGRTQEEEIRRRAADGNIRARDDKDGRGRVAAAAPQIGEHDMEQFRTFTDSVIGLLGQPTSDGRMLAADIDLSFRAFPLPLMWCRQSKEGHSDSFTVGVIESARLEGDRVLASGYLLNSAEADEAADQLAHGVTSPSVDLAAAEWTYTDDSGAVVDDTDLWERVESGLPVVMTFTAAELIGTTLVATAAFGDTRLELNADRESRDVALVAAAAADFRPPVYDHRLFANPNLPGPTMPTMGADGRIYGHLAVFGQCHRSIQTECVMVPRSPSDYAHFHTSPAVRLDNGQRLPVGRLTVGTGHADPKMSAAPAAAHYDNTGTCFALVRVGEDEHGVWFSGVAAPWATPEQVEQGISAPLSGDWRNFGQGLDLVAALAVNTPGFSARGRDDDQGQPLALVASVGPFPKPGQVRGGLTRSQIKATVLEALREDSERKARAAAAFDAVSRAHTLIGRPPAPTPTRTRVGYLLAMARMTPGRGGQ